MKKISLSEQLKRERQKLEKTAIAPKEAKIVKSNEQKKSGPKPNPNAIKGIQIGARLNEYIVEHMRIVSLKLNVSQKQMIEIALLKYFTEIGEACNESIS